MDKPVLGLGEKSMKPYNTKEETQKAKRISFSAFLFSIFIYLSFFYVSHLSPSTLFHDTKFWFFISNNIILIIAVDSGAFSSSKPKHDLYEEYSISSRARSASSSVSPSPENGTKSNPELLEKKQMISPKSIELSLKITPKTDSEGRNCDSLEESKPDFIQKGEAESYNKKKIIEARCYRSKSKKAITVVNDNNKKILRRTKTDKREPRSEENEFSDNLEPSPEENEFSAMSDEELNRRVEEFIERFNRQIRLQENN